MKAYNNFIRELGELLSFYRATIYSFEQTEMVLSHWKKGKLKYDEPSETGLTINQPNNYKIKRSNTLKIRKDLRDVVFVRIISALEVFLVDLIRDAFLVNKEPFKKNDAIIQFSHAELLSMNSPAELLNKVINKEVRKLTSGGFGDIIKYYKKHFEIELASFTPGKSKMEEYHDRRHLLVHRLGKTDQQYRDKYKTTKPTITIEEQYLLDCFEDFKNFAELVNYQVFYKLKNDFAPKNNLAKCVERKLQVEVEFLNGKEPSFLDDSYEFWAGDDFSMFADILDERKYISDKIFIFNLSGTFRQIKSFSRILRRAQKQKEVQLTKVSEISTLPGDIATKSRRVLDNELLEEIKAKLPKQPWQKGIHKIIATELNLTNSLVSAAIQQFMAMGVFKNQVDGILVEKESENNKAEA